jgi:hypothetical protein
MPHLGIDAGTGILGHFPAGRIHHVATEKRPRAAHRRFRRMHGAALIEKKTPAIMFGAQALFAAHSFHAGCGKFGNRELEMAAEPGNVHCRQDNAPLALAAVAAAQTRES